MPQVIAAAPPARPRRAPMPHKDAANESELASMKLSVLIQRCRAESERFFRAQPYDQRYAYELFRRALVERDEAAWETLYEHYRSLVQGWVCRSTSFVASGESCEFFVNAAFTRFWRAISPARFASFPTLASVLNYLQRCAQCAVLDGARAYSAAEVLPEETDENERAPHLALEDHVLQQIWRQEFWHYVETQLNSEAERVVIIQTFVLGRKPRDIYPRYPQLFGSVNDVYLVKRYVLERLSRNQDVRDMIE